MSGETPDVEPLPPRFVVLNRMRSDELRYISYVGDSFDTLPEARARATRRASERGQPYYVAQILGAQTPVYDPEIGWVPAGEET